MGNAGIFSGLFNLQGKFVGSIPLTPTSQTNSVVWGEVLRIVELQWLSNTRLQLRREDSSELIIDLK